MSSLERRIENLENSAGGDNEAARQYVSDQPEFDSPASVIQIISVNCKKNGSGPSYYMPSNSLKYWGNCMYA